jgi:hypothetical protein
MQRTTTITILVCLGAIVIAMTMLYWTSPISEEIKPYPFSRSFANATITQEAIIEPDEKNLYFAGTDEGNIYFGHHRMPYMLIKCSKDLKHSEKIGLKMKGVDSVRSLDQFKIIVEPPYFYIANGMMPILVRGNIGHWIADTIVTKKDYYFTDVVPITSTTFALRSFSEYQNGLQLALLNRLDTPRFKFNFNLLTQQQDGLFSVYGYIIPYKQENKIIYVYTYRNQYLVIDSNMQNHQIKNTIDSFSIAPIRVGSYNQNSQHALSSPGNVVNGASCVYKNNLYIKSTLLAKNEDVATFMNSSTIDVYDLKKGEYAFSFHIPNLNNNKFTDFRIVDDYIYVILKNKIAKFKIIYN